MSFLGNSKHLQVFVAVGDFLHAPEKFPLGNKITPCGNCHVAGRYVFVYVMIATLTDPEPRIVKQNRLVYAMRVTEEMTFNEYWTDSRFPADRLTELWLSG